MVELLKKENLKDILPLSPLQNGIYFHSVCNPEQLAYFSQTSYRISGEVNISHIYKSFSELFNRYENLKVLFKQKGSRIFQIVLKERPVDFTFIDLSDKANKEETLCDFKDSDKQRRFHLEKDMLMRLAVLRLNENEFEFVWSHHHILMDGWCTGILISDFFEIYNSLEESRNFNLPKVTPYRDYLNWIQSRNWHDDLEYWRNYLADFSVPSFILEKKHSEDGYILGQYYSKLDKSQSESLRELTIKYKITLNTIVQVAWGILLCKYNNKQDSVFGAVVSGRPVDIRNVESMVGLFINTVPVRIKFDKETKFLDLINAAQVESLEREKRSYCQLSDIQNTSHLKANLFDNFLTFENQPASETIFKNENKSDTKFSVDQIKVFEQNSYSFNLIINPAAKNTFEVKYNTRKITESKVIKIMKNFNEIMTALLINESCLVDEIKLSHSFVLINNPINLSNNDDFNL